MAKKSLSDKRSSKIKSLYIPTPNFIFFHKPSSEGEVDDRFIGREDISKQLTNWLEDGDSGSYLVTGYRGMGKSSFVGKVLNDITDTDKKKRTYFNRAVIFIYILFIAALLVPICIESIGGISLFGLIKPIDEKKIIFIYICTAMAFAATIALLFFVIWLYGYLKKRWKRRQCDELKNIQKKQSFFRHEKWFKEVFKIKFNDKKNKRRIVIKINLGHEILNEKDVLSLITKRIHDEYIDYTNNLYTRTWFSSIKFALFSVLAALILFFSINSLNKSYENIIANTENEKETIISISTYQNDSSAAPFHLTEQKTEAKSNIFKVIKDEIETLKFLVLLINLLTGIAIFFLLRFIYNKIIQFIPILNKMSTGGVLKDLKNLNDRIDSSINENLGPAASYNPSLFGISISKRKSKSYASAGVREIESELIRILEKINNLEFGKPRFIIVFDELDKIDPEYNYETKSVKETIPEYEKEMGGFSGGMVSRKRKHNVLKLLGNMKLFVSSAKAKFVFISGRELYDAYLADLTDREFAISSIFNGAIYVNSFFESSDSQKNIISKTEEYICRQLIPKKYYIKKAKERYREDKTKIIPDLQLYRVFLREEVFKNDLDNYDFFMDKVILFLYQFAVYLSHISNGSPKKIALYFEKYIDYLDVSNEKNPFNICKKKYLKKTKYCLKFDVIAQQSIGFVHYVAYPVIQGIINRSNHYGDKLLVSASFLIDHIYKHHKGGFSRDNIEHIPELLETYRTPELRNFINSIIAFLKQTHISYISSGLYYYKFRKWISFEISYFSKISEDVSALFNFTLDESLSVKRHYYQQVDYHIKLYTQHIESNNNANSTSINPYSITLIQLYKILGELHLLDDEFSDAIMKFQSGLQLIKSELHIGKKRLEETQFSRNHLQLMLLMIKNVLKLGLTHECQRTYNDAYAVYCELITYLIKFRYIDEKELGLSYAYRDVFDTRQRKSVIFYHEKTEKETEQNKQSVDNKFVSIVNPNLMENKFENNNSEIAYEKIDYIILGDNLITGLSKPLTPDKNAIISRLTLFEDIQFMYQTILTKLFVLEKIDLGGITQTNLDVAESEFAYMYLATNSQDKYLLAADFYRKLGAILYFKNSYIRINQASVSLNLKLWGYDIFNDINNFCVNSKNSVNSKGIITMEFLYDFVNCIEFNDITFDKKIKTHKSFKKSIIDNLDVIFDRYEEQSNAAKFNKSEISSVEREKTKKILKEIVSSFFNSDYFRLPDTFNFQDLNNCVEHNDCCKLKGIHIPCYACNYFSRSLNIFAKYLLKKNEGYDYGLSINNESRVFDFINELNTNNQEITSQRSSYLLTLASTLRGMGDVQLSCSGENDTIKNDFLEFFFNMISQISNKKRETDLPYQFSSLDRIGKAILYYWTASEYFRMASSNKDTAECLRKILHVFVTYAQVKETPFDIKYLENIKKYIVEKAIMNIYTEYDNINIAEIQNIKWIFGKNILDRIDLSKLSNFPDIEELLFFYYELELLFGKKELCIQCYNSILLSRYRIENSMYEKIYSLEFKAFMNMEIIKDITKKCNLNPLAFHVPEFSYLYFEFLDIYLNNFNLTDCDYSECIIVDENKTAYNSLDKMEILNFLISDSIFCLTQIIEILSSSQVSQFTNSFIADIYHQLFNWVQLHVYNGYMCYEIQGNCNEPKKDYIALFTNIMKRRAKCGNTEIDSFYLNGINQVYENAKNAIRRYGDKLSPIKIENNLLRAIGNGNRHFLIPNYSAEMAIKYYGNAKETHTEGTSYKEMIFNMYILDDDINNANITFSLALERYNINNGQISNKSRQLKLVYGNATYYDAENYIQNN